MMNRTMAHEFNRDEHRNAGIELCAHFHWEIVAYKDGTGRGEQATIKTQNGTIMDVAWNLHPKSFDGNGHFVWQSMYYPTEKKAKVVFQLDGHGHYAMAMTTLGHDMKNGWSEYELARNGQLNF